MDWSTIFPSIISFIGVALATFVNYRLGRLSADLKDRSELRQLRNAGDDSFRDDLLETIKMQSETIRESEKIRGELQNTIDAERTRRRMNEAENDHLVRQISKLQIEKEQLLNRMNELEQRITQLENKLLERNQHE